MTIELKKLYEQILRMGGKSIIGEYDDGGTELVIGDDGVEKSGNSYDVEVLNPTSYLVTIDEKTVLMTFNHDEGILVMGTKVEEKEIEEAKKDDGKGKKLSEIKVKIKNGELVEVEGGGGVCVLL